MWTGIAILIATYLLTLPLPYIASWFRVGWALTAYSIGTGVINVTAIVLLIVAIGQAARAAGPLPPYPGAPGYPAQPGYPQPAAHQASAGAPASGSGYPQQQSGSRYPHPGAAYPQTQHYPQSSKQYPDTRQYPESQQQYPPSVPDQHPGTPPHGGPWGSTGQ